MKLLLGFTNMVPNITLERCDFLGERIDETLNARQFIADARSRAGLDVTSRVAIELDKLPVDVTQLRIAVEPAAPGPYSGTVHYGEQRLYEIGGTKEPPAPKSPFARNHDLYRIDFSKHVLVLKRSEQRWNAEGCPLARMWELFYIGHLGTVWNSLWALHEYSSEAHRTSR